MKKPCVCVIRTAGTNCDREAAFAFQQAGAQVEIIHINRFLDGTQSFRQYHIAAFPGGFSYGDDIAAGRIMANELRFKLGDALRTFLGDGKLIIGICNGFQILVKAGLLPGHESFSQEASLIINDSGKFEDRWVYLRSKDEGPRTKENMCVWTKGLPEVIYLPVAHGEGKFVTKDEATLSRLKENGQIVFRYCDEKGKPAPYPANPNGSTDEIAGICDETGRILGLMPHPERHVNSRHHPQWMDRGAEGLQIFRNGVEFVRQNL